MAVFTLDGIYLWSQIAVVVFGLAALITGKLVNDRETEKNERQATALLTLSTKLEEQREKTALAERATLELGRLIKEPRTIDRKRGDEILDWGKKGSVDISYVAIGDEPSNLAKQLAEILFAHGWTIVAVNSAVVAGGPRPGLVIHAHGDEKGTTVVTKWEDAPEPAKTLHRLLTEALTGNPMVETRVTADQPEGALRVLIALKY